MKKLLIYISLSLCIMHAYAQTGYADISGKFMQYYNAQTPDSIFRLYSPELREKISQEKTQAVISGLHIQYGDLQSLRLLKQDSGYNIYKARFVHQTLCLLIELNSDEQLNGYRLVPYKPDMFPEEKNK